MSSVPAPGEGAQRTCDQRPTDPAPSFEPLRLRARVRDIEDFITSILIELGEMLPGAIDACEDEPGMSLSGTNRLIEEGTTNIVMCAASIRRELHGLVDALRERGVE